MLQYSVYIEAVNGNPDLLLPEATIIAVHDADAVQQLYNLLFPVVALIYADINMFNRKDAKGVYVSLKGKQPLIYIIKAMVHK